MVFMMNFHLSNLNRTKSQTILLICRRGNFIFHHWICITIYRSMSYRLGSIDINPFDANEPNDI